MTRARREDPARLTGAVADLANAATKAASDAGQAIVKENSS